MQIETKMPYIGTTIFTTMTKLAQDHNALNLGQGFPDFDTDPKLLDMVTQAMAQGHNQYPQMPGVLPLRQAIQKKVKAIYDRHYDHDNEITVTSGAAEALMSSIMAFVRPGDEVVVLEPCYDLYIPTIKLAGGTPVPVPMNTPTPQHPYHSVDWQRVRAAVSGKTRMLILNFPHNPTGTVLSPADLDELEKIVNDTGILLLSDEVYEHIVFDGQPHQGLARREALAANAIIVSSFGKTYHVTGWKVGYVCAPAKITAEIRKVHQFTVFTTTSPMQYALANYMADPAPYESLPSFYQEKRDLLTNALKNSRFRVLPSQGTFFLLADYSEISNDSELDFVKWLTTSHRLGAIPVSAFYANPDAQVANNNLIRLCFAKRDATLLEAAEKLQAV
jgi:methionine aminotransferase